MPNFISYSNQLLSPEQISHYAHQYVDVDMWQLTGQDEDYFPFVIGDDLTNYRIVYWSKKHIFLTIFRYFHRLTHKSNHLNLGVHHVNAYLTALRGDE